MESAIRILIYITIYIGLFTLAYYLLGFLERKKSNFKKLVDPFVTVIIPALNEEANLRRTVESVVNLNYPKHLLEVIIVDDGSKDQTKTIAFDLAKKYKIVRAFSKENGGKASALNYGIKRAKGEIIVGFDGDSMVTPDALKKMVPYFDDSRVMCVTPAMKVHKPKGILQRVQAIEYDLGIFLRKAFANINAIHVTPGPFSAFRKEFFQKHGGFDVKNITEDMEIALRIQSLNYRIENSPGSVVYTLAPRKFFPLARQRRRWYFGLIKNFWQYRRMFSKRYGEMGLLIFPMAILSIISTMAVTFYYIFNGVTNYIQQLEFYSLIGFDFLNNLRFRGYFLELSLYRAFSDGILIFGLFFFFATLLTLLIINKKISSIDRPLTTFINYVFFIFLYSLLFSIWWVVSIFYSLTRREIGW